MTTKLTILILAAFPVLAGLGQDTPSAERLEYARYLREAKHDTPKAMAELEKILAASPPAETALHARLLLTACQLELGQKDAASKGLESLISQKPGAPADPDMAAFAEQLRKIETSAITPLSRQQLLEAALKGVAEKLGTGAEFIDAEATRGFKETMNGKLVGIGAVLAKVSDGVRVQSVVKGSPAEAAGIREGWVMTRIDGKSIDEIGPLQKVVNAVRGAQGSTVEIVFRLPDGGGEKTLTIRRETIRLDDDGLSLPPQGAPGVDGFVIDKEAGIVALPVHSFATGLAEQVRTVLTDLPGMKGLLIDLRGNGGGGLEEMVEVASLLLPKDTLVAIQQLRNAPPDKRRTKAEPVVSASVPVLVLVDERTASGAELFAAALQDQRRAVVFGQRTSGHGRIHTLTDSVAGGTMKLPIGELLRGNGSPIHRQEGAGPEAAWGVTPDVTGPKPGAVGVDLAIPPGASAVEGSVNVRAKFTHRETLAAAVARLKGMMANK